MLDLVPRSFCIGDLDHHCSVLSIDWTSSPLGHKCKVGSWFGLAPGSASHIFSHDYRRSLSQNSRHVTTLILSCHRESKTRTNLTASLWMFSKGGCMLCSYSSSIVGRVHVLRNGRLPRGRFGHSTWMDPECLRALRNLPSWKISYVLLVFLAWWQLRPVICSHLISDTSKHLHESTDRSPDW